MTPGSSTINSIPSFISAVSNFMDQNQLINVGDTIIVAVSGGRDSMALLYVLHQLRAHRSIKLRALHVGHGLRGAESDADAQLVKAVCGEKDIPLDVEYLSGFTLNSSEEKLRDARYGVFERTLNKYPGAKLATAHHLNDQLETFFMRLFRGSGLKGLRGIPIKRGRYIRPFLSVSREQISGFCRDAAVKFRDDSSNADSGKLRNRIRHELLPVVQTIWGADALDSFEQSRRKMADFFASFQDVNRPVFREMLNSDKTGWFCAVEALFKLDPPQQLAFLDYCFFTIYHLSLPLAANRFKELKKFLETAANGSFFFLVGSRWILKDRSRFYFVNRDKKEIQSTKLFIGKPVHFGLYEICIEPVSAKDIQFSNNPDTEYICGDTIQLPLNIRTWHAGDWFMPLGQTGKQKLSDYFINKKLNILQKEQVPLIFDGGSLVWIAGMRLDARYKTDKNCRTVYMLTIAEREKC